MARTRKQPIAVITGRVVHHFWLNLNKDAENKLDQAVRELKKRRLFAETLRDGLRLILDLQAGSLTVLFELFPNIREHLIEQGASPSGGAGQLEEIKSMLEIVLAEKRDDDRYQMHSAQPLGSIKPDSPAQASLNAPVAVVKQAAVVSADLIADNFLSMFQ